jgi:prepilin-type N-terminal cleavage/methylation domain-containing protein
VISSTTHRQEGYTLIETIVAMALFLSAALPLISLVSKLMLDDGTERIWIALSLAENELDAIAATPAQGEDMTREEGSLTIVRRVTRHDRRVDVTVQVTHLEGDKPIVELSRSFLK